jgi:hypothetical protein
VSPIGIEPTTNWLKRSRSCTLTSMRRTADYDGIVIELRNNLGGFVNAYALDVFSRGPYDPVGESRLCARPLSNA